MRQAPLLRRSALLLPLALAACAASTDPLESEPIASTSSALGTLAEVAAFGTNPGALKMFEYAPATLPKANGGLIVVLHGCTQGASNAAAQGWNDIAEERGFLVVYPEQQVANNQTRCFNWGGVYGDLSTIGRGKDENESIKQMVDKAIADHTIDPKRVFVAGFSAGGGQAAVMAATWPDVFAGAAMIAGIPYHCNTTFAEAFSCQKPGKNQTPAQWAKLVKDAYASYTGPYPRISIWQGASDTIVGPANRTELVEQWTEVHGVGQTPSASGTVDGAAHSEFKDGSGKVVVETYEVPGMDHGIGVVPAQKCGAAGAYALDKGICAAGRIASFFGLEAGSTGGPGSSSGASGSSGASSGGTSGTNGAASSSTSSSSSGGAAPAANGGGGGSDGSAASTCTFAPAAPSSATGTTLLGLALALAVVRRRKSDGAS
jgi:poly(hydroxyalkanoate) depolymerase family esterase